MNPVAQRFCGLLLLMSLGLAAAARAETLSAPALLQAMVDASKTLEYRGRLLYLHGSNISTLELLKGRFEGRDYERLTQLDGQLSEVIRRGDQTVCVHADKSITRLVNRNSVSPLGLTNGLSKTVPEQYQLLLDGDDRVAGRSAHRLLLLPLDSFRYGYRIWIDQQSSLLLKSELVDGTGMALERLEFISLELSPGLRVEDFSIPASLTERALDSLDVANHPQGQLRLVPDWVPAGFTLVDRDLRLGGEEHQPVSASTWSDGLAAFTVFVEELENDVWADEVSQMGPTVAISRRVEGAGGRYIATLVGEVPALTAERVLSGLSLGFSDD